MEHHPDRGGDEARLQAINAAMDLLAKDARRVGNKKA
jgi:curved DNA-binding protein CbpA